MARGLYSGYTLLQALQENIARQIDANEYHFAHSLLLRLPRLAQITAHELVNALENHFALGAFHVQNAFVTQHPWAVNIDDGTQEIFQFRRVQGSICLEDKAFHIVIVVMVVAMTVSMRMVMVTVVVVLV